MCALAAAAAPDFDPVHCPFYYVSSFDSLRFFDSPWVNSASPRKPPSKAKSKPEACAARCFEDRMDHGAMDPQDPPQIKIGLITLTTLPKTNMDPKNGTLKDCFPLLAAGFQGAS